MNSLKYDYFFPLSKYDDVMLKIPYLLKLNPWFVGIVCFSCERIVILQAVQPNNKQLILDAQLLVGVFHTLVHRLLLHRLHWPEREKNMKKNKEISLKMNNVANVSNFHNKMKMKMVFNDADSFSWWFGLFKISN